MFKRLMLAVALITALTLATPSTPTATAVSVYDSVTFTNNVLTIHEFDGYASTMLRLHIGYNRVTIVNTGNRLIDAPFTVAYTYSQTVTSTAWIHIRYWTPAGWTDYYRSFTAAP